MRLNRLDLNLILVLDAILEERSVTKAAERLKLSQATVSNALRRLRDHYGDPLLVATPHGMQPTAFGMEIAADMRAAATISYRLASARAQFDPISSTRRFVVSASDYATTLLMTPVLRRLATEAPKMVVELTSLSDNPAGALERGVEDFVILPYGLLTDRYSYEVLFQDEFVCIAWAGNSWIGDHLTLEQFRTAPQVIFHQRGAPDPVDNTRPTHNAEALSSHYMLLPNLVDGTDRIAVVHRRVFERQAKDLDLKVLPLPYESSPLIECLHWHPRGEDSARQWFRKLIKEVASTI